MDNRKRKARNLMIRARTLANMDVYLDSTVRKNNSLIKFKKKGGRK